LPTVDSELAIRDWLRTQTSPTVKVWFDMPKGDPSFPLITIGGRIGGAPDQYVPTDEPRISFQVWGGAMPGQGRQNAIAALGELVTALESVTGLALNASVYAYEARVDSMLWLPDDSDPDNVLARYVVDTTWLIRSV
jgi:hypothetical protein